MCFGLNVSISEAEGTENRRQKREDRTGGVGVRGWSEGMNEHALWADLRKVVEVQEAALVGAR